MKLKYFVFALLAFGLSMQSAVAQNDNNEVDVQVFDAVLKTADWANFKYLDNLARAKQGDIKATLELLQFSGTVDGAEALDHSVTLLELIASGGDQPFAQAASQAKPKLKTVLLDRLQIAQGRTKKEELRKPLAQWAPSTLDVLNGKPFVKKLDPAAEKSCLQSHEPGAVVKMKPEMKSMIEEQNAKAAAPSLDGPAVKQ